MSSDIIAALHLERETLGSVIVAKEINNCDSSFIISCVLGHCIKNRNAVILISTHDSMAHYQYVGSKMNYNLEGHMELGLISFFDLGEECINILLKKDNNSIQYLISKLNERILKITEKYDKVNIILDGVSHLFDMDFNLKSVNHMCNELVNLSRKYSSFILFHCNVASDDDVTNVMANLLSHKAHILLEVESLKSGWSADATGHLTIKYIGQKFNIKHMYTMELKASHYLFKLFDRGVKLFAPGTV
ncbi:elongator complex protein 6 [Achroia grisella]|uniref:elongator complex protein 6 n=1 Tax=Achroia grisella TaxID=688607 RepID=UPI0027D286F8|nr:elongator complex protein 6 [Achroia grisella]